MYEKKDSEVKGIEKELINLYDLCKESGFSTEEMRKIWKPLTAMVHRYKMKLWARRFAYAAIFICAVYVALQSDNICWHLSAIGRIIMIEMLPLWDWRPLFGEKCLIKNFMLPRAPPQLDCTLCEAIDAIPVELDIDPDRLSEIYLKVDTPVIVTDGARDWPIFQNASMDIQAEILTNEKLRGSYPCSLSSNIVTKDVSVKTLFVQTSKFRKWFFHFENCEKAAMRQFRLFAPRPYFVDVDVSPTQSSWLLMSTGYDAPKYKRVALREKIAVFGQARGSHAVRLTPRLNCADECPVLETQLEAGEALLFTSMWDLEYKPNKDTFNVAAILEMY